MSKLRADGMAELEFAQLNVMVVVDETFSQTLVVRLLEGLGVASVTAAAPTAPTHSPSSRPRRPACIW